jgi:DNA primase
VIAFGGRVLDGGQPKYLNSSETPIYRKSATLYGLSMAKNEIAREGSALVVEGYTDVIALSQAGIKNAIATLGTAFTAGHIELLKRFSDRIVLVFDADVAGTKAAESASAYLSEFRPPKTEALRDLERRSGVTGIDVRVVVLPRNLDPADYIALQGADDFRVLINSAEPFFDFYLTRELDKYNISETQQKEQAALAGLKFIATLDPLTHEEYLGKIARKLELDERVLAVRFNAMFKKSMPIRSEARRASINPQDKVERSLLHLMMKYSGIREKITAEVVEDYFVSPAHAQLFAVLKKMGAGKFDTKVLDDLDKGLRARATALFLAEPEYEEKNVSKYFEDILASFKDFYFKRQISKLRQKLESPSVQKDKAYYDALFEELIALEAKRRALR